MAFTRQLIANRYQLIRQLAAGSYAETWLATDLALDRNVAIKLLHSRVGNSREETNRFLREARIAAAVNHPNIVAVFDAGSETGQPFLVMEWISGTSLKQTILQRRRIDLTRAIAVSTQLLDGLSAIHATGIIHRDIKPQNVMVSDSGTVKLTDFGIARLMNETDINADGMTAGSAAYMAPEQAQGRPVSPASDIYATGVILYELLTGRLPFTGTDPQEVMRKHINDPIIRPRRFNPEIPPELEAVTLRALSKDPLDRFQSADDMRYELLWARRSLSARRSAPHAPSPKIDWALPRFAWMAASVVLMMVMIVGATTLAVRDSTTSSDAANVSSATVTPGPTLTPLPEPSPTSEPSWVMTMRDASPPEIELPENDEVIVRGEVRVAGVPEVTPGINRPAPTSDEAERVAEQPVVSVGTGGNAPPPPTPTPTPEVEEEPADEEEVEGEESDDGSEDQENEEASDEAADEESGESGSNNGNQGDSSDQEKPQEQPDNGNGNSNGNNEAGNGNSNNNGNNNGSDVGGQDQINDTEDPAATNQQSDVAEDSTVEEPAVTNQGQVEDGVEESETELLEDQLEEADENENDDGSTDVENEPDEDEDDDDGEDEADGETELLTAQPSDESQIS